jgi:hypothetical protein
MEKSFYLLELCLFPAQTKCRQSLTHASAKLKTCYLADILQTFITTTVINSVFLDCELVQSSVTQNMIIVALC